MPTLDRVIEHRKDLFNESMALIERKGHDYNRQQQNDGDTLFNLKVAELLGIVPTAERGILVRLSDKFMRLISLMQPGVDPSVKGESVRDTVRDIHNYVDYALLLWEERNNPEDRATEGARRGLVTGPRAETKTQWPGAASDMSQDPYMGAETERTDR